MNRINRIKSENGFTIINNAVFEAELSARAMGLLCYILHLPADWVLYKTYLYEKLPEGRDAINTAWNELSEKGFILSKKNEAARGKLPETNYFVYDFPQNHVDNPLRETRQSETTTSKNQHLQSTNKKQRTKKQIIPSIPDGIDGPPKQKSEKAVDKQPEIQEDTPSCAAPPQPEKKQTLYSRFLAVYDDWHKGLNDGVPPKFDGAACNAAKAIISYLRTVVKAKAKLTNLILDEVSEEENVIKTWQYVLKHWHNLDPFLQNKTGLLDINSKIQDILKQSKNGYSKNKSGQPTGGNVSTAGIAQTIARHYSGSGNGSGQ